MGRRKSGNPPGNPNWRKGVSGNPATRFRRGRSGNPAGLPKGYIRNIREWARGRTPAAAQALDEMLDDRGDRARLGAVKLVLAYAWGQPENRLELTGAGGGPMRIDVRQLSDAELERLIQVAEGQARAEGEAASSADDDGTEGGEGETES